MGLSGMGAALAGRPWLVGLTTHTKPGTPSDAGFERMGGTLTLLWGNYVTFHTAASDRPVEHADCAPYWSVGCRWRGLVSVPAVGRGAMNSQMDWSGVRDRVIAVVEAVRGPSLFPIFEPVLTAAEIAEVEAQYGVALPDEYRTFLAEVGAGGPGPALELTSLRRVEGRWGWVWDNDEAHPWLLDPSALFIETQEWADQQIATLRAAGCEPTTRNDDDDYLSDYREAFGDAGDEVWHLERGRGAILISDNGCGMTGWLIVVGPHRGELRDRDCDVNPPFEPYVDRHGNRHSFRTWYLEWLEQYETATKI